MTAAKPRPSGSPRTATTAWKRLRLAILARDGYRCRWVLGNGERCQQRARICDHVVPKAEGGTDDPSNLQALCQTHSDTKSAQEGSRGAQRKRDRRLHPSAREEHPGTHRREDA